MTPAPTGWGVPEPGDRSARNTHEYPDLHASDIEEEEYTYHNPWPMAAGEAAVSDGDKLVGTDVATQAELAAHAADPDAHHDEAHTHPLPIFTDAVTDPPTDAELDTALGTPVTVGAGYAALLDNDGAGTDVYLVVSDGTAWWYQALTKAV